mmetsp:Transcript_39476/g.123510  ORF Transcript_39476/g.123510 Transcript_39476/m.123510 type:complete len:445 (-) Transcript_39476:130-1464(-)
MADGKEDDAPARRAPAGTSTSSLSVAMATMENVLDKCFILNYEEGFCKARGIEPLHRAFFAIPADNPSLQFKTFTDLCNWLITDITRDPTAFVVEQFDDPQTSVNKLMLALRSLSFNLDFSANKLRSGSGEQACAVLNFLTDKALEARNFSFERPVYNDEATAEEADVDDDADVGDVEDELEVEVEEEAGAFHDSQGPSDGALNRMDSSHQMLEAKVDPVEWKTELERVGPKLKLVNKRKPGIASGDWRQHVTLTRKHQDTITGSFSGTVEKLSSIRQHLDDAVGRMDGKEKYINNQFEEIRAQFVELKEQLKVIEDDHENASMNVSGLTNELANITEQLEEIREVVHDRSTGISDPSPLVKIKAALQDLRSEVKTFDLRIGVVSHSVVAAKMRVQKAVRENEHQNAEKRNRHRKRGMGGRGGRGMSMNEADDDAYDISDSETF